MSKLTVAAKDPILLMRYFKRSLLLAIEKNASFVGIAANRSDSDNGSYVAAVIDAVNDPKAFRSFRRDPHYRRILEHVSQDVGETYLRLVKESWPELLSRIDAFKANDLVGNPVTFHYVGIGVISPTTLRYMKVASDLRSLFGDEIGESIIEIGGGYGGQALINDRAFPIKKYEILDLPPVLKLIEKYLEGHILNCAYKTSTLNQKDGGDLYDLVISNYAFSELPAHLQTKYIEKILSRCKKGYLTMNSGLTRSERSQNKLTIEDLKNMLPEFEILPEEPFTGTGNYILAWGHK